MRPEPLKHVVTPASCCQNNSSRISYDLISQFRSAFAPVLGAEKCIFAPDFDIAQADDGKVGMGWSSWLSFIEVTVELYPSWW